MSEFLAEASVVIRPDTSKFRATLIAELRKATTGIAVPIPVVAQAKGAQTVVKANKEAAASATQASVATKELTATRTKQIITDRELAGQEANLAKAEQLVAAAQQSVEAVGTASAGATTKLAGARAELTAANKAVALSERAVAAAGLKGAEAQQAEAASALESAVALRAEALALEQATAAQIINTRESAAAIRRNEQLRRGIEANTLSLFKIRGATLAASSGFLIGAAAVTIAAKAVESANVEIEAAARVERVFGENAAGLEKDATGLARSFGLSAAEALKFEGQIGNILKVSKIADDKIPALSEDLVKLAADMAAFNNVPIEQVLKAISLGLVGNSRGLRAFGVELNAAAVNAEALTETGKKSTDELTRGERVQARIALLQAQTILQQGAAARRTDALAQKSRILSAEVHNLGVEFGKFLIPQLVEVVSDGAKVVGVLEKMTKGAHDLASAAEGKVGGKGGGLLGGLVNFGLNATGIFGISGELKNIRTLAHVGSEEFFILKDAIVGAGKSGDSSLKELHAAAVKAFDAKAITSFTNALEGADNAALSLSRTITATLGNTLAKLQDQMVGIKIAGGGAGEQLANLAKQEQAARAAVASAGVTVAQTAGRTGHDTALKALYDRRQALLDIIDQERALHKQIADDAINGAQAIQKVVDDAKAKVQELIAQADQSTLDTISSLAGKLDIPTLRADATASLRDNVALQEAIQASVRGRLALARQIIDVKLRTQTIHDLNVELIRSQIEEKALNQTIAKNAQQRNQARFDRAAESIDLDITLAQTEKNKRAEIRAREARIRLDETREKAVKGDTIATKKLRNDIAEQRAAIKELNKELAKRNDALKEAQFLFLTARAGFVGNLLSNLIPTNVAAGTVGGGAGGGGGSVAGLGGPTPKGGVMPVSATPSGGGGGGFIDAGPQRPPDTIPANAPVSSAVSTATQTHVAQKGASMSQMSTLIHVQRQMLVVLQRLVSQRTHPEASHQKVHTATATDTI